MNPILAAARVRSLPTWLLMRTTLTAQQVVADHLATVGAHRYHYSMLAALDEFGPMSQADLGRRSGLDRSDTSAAVADLVGRDLVERSVDPGDRRRNVVSITAGGITFLERLDAVITEAQNELLASLSSEERRLLTDLLTRLVDSTSGTL